jgi:hypothetical protein
MYWRMAVDGSLLLAYVCLLLVVGVLAVAACFLLLQKDKERETVDHITLLTFIMGCCCSCLKGDGAESNESEMTSTSAAEARGKSLVISQDMSAPTIEIAQDQRSISGNGLALAGVSIEQDAAYWEWHIKIETDGSEDTMFGVSTRKDAAFYRRLEEQDDGKIYHTCMFFE